MVVRPLMIQKASSYCHLSIEILGGGGGEIMFSFIRTCIHIDCNTVLNLHELTESFYNKVIYVCVQWYYFSSSRNPELHWLRWWPIATCGSGALEMSLVQIELL